MKSNAFMKRIPRIFIMTAIIGFIFISSAFAWPFYSKPEFRGRIIQKIETIGGAADTYDYAYDDNGRLTEVKKNSMIVESYTYDANGNRLTDSSRTYIYSPEDHLITAGSDAYQFDADGFLIQKTTSSGTMIPDYSSRGELLSANLPGGTVITYDHDPMGRRITKRVNGIVTEKYLWKDAITLLAIYDGSDNLVMRFNYADGRLPVSIIKGGSTYYLLYDQIGTLKAVADSSGNIVKQIDYDSFGNIISDTNPAFTVPFGFAGGLHDRDTGLVRFGYRDYDPSIGRWTAKDPIDFAGGDPNLYGYVQNNPVNVVDLWGLRVSIRARPMHGMAWAIGDHVAVDVNGEIYGFHPDTGVVREDPSDYTGWGNKERVVHPGNQFDKAFLDYLRNAAAGNDPRFSGAAYDFPWNTCLDFVIAALNEAVNRSNPCQ